MTIKKITYLFPSEYLRSQLFTRSTPIGITIHEDQFAFLPSLFHDLLPRSDRLKRNALRLGQSIQAHDPKQDNDKKSIHYLISLNYLN